MLNSKQLQYAMDRIEEIARQKASAIRESCVICGKSITHKQLDELVKAGKLKLVKPQTVIGEEAEGRRSYSYYPHVNDVWDLTGVVADSNTDGEKAKKRLKVLETEVSAVKDQLVLGDEKAALDMLAKFTNKAF